MTPTEMDALIEQGDIEVLRALKGLSGEEQQIVDRACARLQAAEEPEGVVERVVAAVKKAAGKEAKCQACSHDTHEGRCTYTTTEYECDCVT